MSQVMDSVNKYRHGVLIGNYVEDKFGTDLAGRGPEMDAPKVTAMKTSHHRTNALYQDHEVIGGKSQSTVNYYEAAQHVDRSSYKKPENQTSNDIFYKQQVNNSVPLVPNNPKKQNKQIQEGKIYEQTRNMLANKFVSPYQASQAASERESLRETGNIYDTQGQEIPDILTGEVWRHASKKPDEEVYAPTRDRNEPTTKVHGKANTSSINPYGASSIVRPQVQKYDQQIYKRYVLPNDKGEQRDILLGHGLELDEFQRRQLATCYDLSYNQQIKPQTQVNSFYNPSHTETAKKFHKETLYQKNYQDKIPEYGTKALLGQEKLGRPYDPYTKTYDLNHLKNEYLRK